MMARYHRRTILRYVKSVYDYELPEFRFLLWGCACGQVRDEFYSIADKLLRAGGGFQVIG